MNRLPSILKQAILSIVDDHLIDYPKTRNLNYWRRATILLLMISAPLFISYFLWDVQMSAWVSTVITEFTILENWDYLLVIVSSILFYSLFTRGKAHRTNKFGYYSYNLYLFIKDAVFYIIIFDLAFRIFAFLFFDPSSSFLL